MRDFFQFVNKGGISLKNRQVVCVKWWRHTGSFHLRQTMTKKNDQMVFSQYRINSPNMFAYNNHGFQLTMGKTGKNALNHNQRLSLAFSLLIYTFSYVSNYFIIKFNRITYEIRMPTIIAYHLYAFWVRLSYHHYSSELFMINIVSYYRQLGFDRSPQGLLRMIYVGVRNLQVPFTIIQRGYLVMPAVSSKLKKLTCGLWENSDVKIRLCLSWILIQPRINDPAMLIHKFVLLHLNIRLNSEE